MHQLILATTLALAVFSSTLIGAAAESGIGPAAAVGQASESSPAPSGRSLSFRRIRSAISPYFRFKTTQRGAVPLGGGVSKTFKDGGQLMQFGVQ